MRGTFPLIIQDYHVLSTNLVNEDSSDAWDIATAYSVGDFVHLVATHIVYRCTQDNTGNDPTNDDGTYWVRYGRTNYWNCLANDTAIATEAEGTGGIEYEFEPGGTYDTIAFLGLRCASVQVVVKNASAVTVSDETQTATEAFGSATWYKPALVFDIDVETGFTVEVTIAATGVTDVLAQCAKIVIGNTYKIAETEEDSTTIGFVDYSDKEQDAEGKWTVVDRGFSKKIDFSIAHLSDKNRWVMDVLLWKSTTPCLWWADDGNSLDFGVVVYGYIMEPTLNYGVGWSTTDVEVLGLSFNPPQAFSNTAILDPAPNAFVLSDWSVATGGPDQLDVTISNLPERAEDIKYTVDGGTEVSTGGVVNFSITGLAPLTPYDIVIYAVGSGGDSDPSDTKSATITSFNPVGVGAVNRFTLLSTPIDTVGVGAVNRFALLRTPVETVGVGAVNRLTLLREP